MPAKLGAGRTGPVFAPEPSDWQVYYNGWTYSKAGRTTDRFHRLRLFIPDYVCERCGVVHSDPPHSECDWYFVVVNGKYDFLCPYCVSWCKEQKYVLNEPTQAEVDPDAF